MPPVMCPRCVTELEDKGEWWSGRTCECGKCKGILADKTWLESNMLQSDYMRLSKRVFTGSRAGIFCPHCLSARSRGPIEMSKFTVSPGGKGYEVDGCLQCGSMWFDKGELESYEEGEVGDPSLVKTRNETTIVEKAASGPFAAANSAGGIFDLLVAILSGF